MNINLKAKFSDKFENKDVFLEKNAEIPKILYE